MKQTENRQQRTVRNRFLALTVALVAASGLAAPGASAAAAHAEPERSLTVTVTAAGAEAFGTIDHPLDLEALLGEVRAAPCWENATEWCQDCAQMAQQFCSGCLYRGFDCAVGSSPTTGACSCTASCSLCQQNGEMFARQLI